MDKAVLRPRRSDEDPEVMLGLLAAVEANEHVTQRTLASELGIALGLVNAYLKRCVKKGLIKVHDAPARRYAYYLTPQGFAEKSRLTVDYLSHSFSFFRRARLSCSRALGEASARGWRNIVLIGASELAEVANLCALETPLTVVSVFDPDHAGDRFAGLAVVNDADTLCAEADGAILTATTDTERWHQDAIAILGAERIVVPDLLTFAIRRRARFEEFAVADGADG